MTCKHEDGVGMPYIGMHHWDGINKIYKSCPDCGVKFDDDATEG